eukprot:scaffold137152_cov37-Tisochrysis_lutea.AAC.1
MSPNPCSQMTAASHGDCRGWKLSGPSSSNSSAIPCQKPTCSLRFRSRRPSTSIALARGLLRSSCRSVQRARAAGAPCQCSAL